MIRNSIVAKLWLTIVAMVIIVLVLLFILLQQFFDNYVYQQQTRELTRLAQSVQVLVQQQHNPGLANKLAQQLAFVQNAKITESVPYSQNSALNTTYQSFTPQQQQWFKSGQAVIIRGDQLGKSSVSVYLIIPNKSAPGMVVVTQQMSVLDAPLARMRNLILFAMALGVLLVTGLAFIVSKNLSRPLIQMNRVAEAMARGDFDGTINVLTNDEVGRLGRTFNALANELASTIAALSLETNQLSSILSSLEDGVVAADLEGTITLVNPPGLRRLRSLLLSETGVPELTNLPASMVPLMQSAIDKNGPVVRDARWQGRELTIVVTPLYESGGAKIRGVVYVIRDVTEERRLDRLRKDFIANVSHELRTPLSMMQGYTEALLDEFGDDPQQRRELTEIIHDETLRMRRLVNDLLDLAQLESGQFQMNFAQTNVSALVKRVARKFQTLAAEREIHVITNLQPGPIEVLGDFDRLEQVFTNLLDNAIRHTGSGGTVSVTTQTSAKYAQVVVSDTGSGIPEEDIPYIWERFYKADKARTRGSSGTGLGLAITRHIVLEHRGDIIVESKTGQGTSFTVSIPLLENPETK
ncbi:cell wall metabolism sensor histidine kinase WalK [Alicyclobacillus tolerans]|uniref:ATP-binding protein n=1 Tax=Alicyclobacillus tolerans TaxID=90970 RepID=UPI001F39451C|nr:ATP-binding protein [Alicyclobacillus tolerans]MCF8563693.1 cell wall metabolism sensor histidine kinase WalK [Alicyclobacillus tolerans]